MNSTSQQNQPDVAEKSSSHTDTPSFPAHIPAIAELVFDSAEKSAEISAAAGVRGGYLPARQLLYKFGSVCVDMRMQPELGSQEVVLTGQILDSEKPGYGLGGVPVSLLCADRAVENKKTNSAGEFYFGFRSLHHAQLVFGMGARRSLVVPVPDAGADSPGQEAYPRA
ncbi:MAG TPA: hypothetical protein VMH85_06635 [Terriglobales bacterium]|nr:hypothetical protein [Terriglobales bacterium]